MFRGGQFFLLAFQECRQKSILWGVESIFFVFWYKCIARVSESILGALRGCFGDLAVLLVVVGVGKGLPTPVLTG